MHTDLALVLLLAVASIVALAARGRVPYTVALVVVGFVVGSFHVIPAPRLTKELLFTAFLPGLLFEAAFHLGARDLAANARVILGLAIPGVAVAAAVTGGLLVLFGIPPREAFVFGAIVGATDPLAVVSVFKKLGAPRRLRVCLEGESLLNDGTSVVLVPLVVSAGTGELALARGALEAARVVGVGATCGLAVGYVLSKVIARAKETEVEMGLTILTAYGSFTVAEALHGSGVIATVAAGIVAGSYGAPRGMSSETRAAVESFWQLVAFVLNSLVFLLVGTEASLVGLARSYGKILAGFGAMTVARALLVLLAVGLLRRTRERMPFRWAVMIGWGGLRGALSLVLALGLPRDFEGAGAVVSMTAGAVLLSIVVQGLTAAPLLRALGLAQPRDAGPV